jgi:hypothetical protein
VVKNCKILLINKKKINNDNMDRDAQLIFENYKKDVQLINEAVPVLAILAAIAAPIAAVASGNYGLTTEFMKSVKRSSNGLIDLEGLLEHPVGQFLSIFDPTGLTNWPEVEKNVAKYKADPSDENKFELYLSVFFSIPMIGKLKILKSAWAGKSAIAAAGKNAYILKALMAVIEKILNTIFSKPEFKKGFGKIFRSSPEPIKQTLVAILGILGARSLLANVGANVLTSASSDDAESEDNKPSPSPSPKPLPKPSPKPSSGESSKKSSNLPDINF